MAHEISYPNNEAIITTTTIACIPRTINRPEDLLTPEQQDKLHKDLEIMAQQRASSLGYLAVTTDMS